MRRLLLPLLVAIPLTACSNPKTKEGQESSVSTAAFRSTSAEGQSTLPPQGHGEHTGHGDHTGHGSATATPHSDHDASYGGVLTMEGENHAEIVVDMDGTINLYVSDAVRKPIPVKDISGTITIESAGKQKQTLVLAENMAQGSLSAKAPPPDKTLYTWNLKIRGTPMMMSLEVPAGGTAAIAQASLHDSTSEHTHRAPHGGTVQTLGDGHMEAKLDPTGEVTVWFFDASERPRSAKGVVATIRPVVAGSKEVNLEYDATADALRGKVDPIKQKNLDALFAVTPEGGTTALVRFKFDIEGKG